MVLCMHAQGHREGCMCVICKQARRSGRPWAGMIGGDAASFWLPPGAAGPGKGAAGPPIRFGKRAYVRAVPQLPMPAHRAPVWLPLLYCLSATCPRSPHGLFPAFPILVCYMADIYVVTLCGRILPKASMNLDGCQTRCP